MTLLPGAAYKLGFALPAKDISVFFKMPEADPLYPLE
jgi:hypothetical protein